MYNRIFGKCLLFSGGPAYWDCNQTAFNHLHILIQISMASKEAWGSFAQHATPKSNSWDLEKLSNIAREFFDPKREKQDSFL